MSQRNSISRTVEERLTRLRAATGIPTGAIILSVLGVLSLMEVSSAAGTCAIVFSFGGLLLVAVRAVERGWQEPRKCLAECRPARIRALRHR